MFYIQSWILSKILSQYIMYDSLPNSLKCKYNKNYVTSSLPPSVNKCKLNIHSQKVSVSLSCV